MSLKALREKAGKSLEDAAAACGVDPSTFWRWEEGIIKKGPSVEQANKLCEALGCTTNDLFNGGDAA